MQGLFFTLCKSLKYRAIQILIILALYLLLADAIPLTLHRAFYTFSVLIKDILTWMLPVTVGLFIAQAVSSFRAKAPLFVLALILFEGISNLTSVWYAFGAGQIAADLLPKTVLPAMHLDFDPLWRLPLIKPAWWSADKGTLCGLFLGFLSVFTRSALLREGLQQGKVLAETILTRVFSRLIPLFVLGFVARMVHTQGLHVLFAQYGILLLSLIPLLFLYVLFLFFLGSDGTLKGVAAHIKNLLPAGALAFTSGCSLSTMPWTIAGAAKNLKQPGLAKAIIPATTNIQQIGDCIINAFLCFLIYKTFNGHPPELATWVSFSLVFVLARFATAAIIGGAIFIMLPIYEVYLGFNAEMIALILAFNVILDPLVTSSNVLANGALCRVFEKFWVRLSGRQEATQSDALQ